MKSIHYIIRRRLNRRRQRPLESSINIVYGHLLSTDTPRMTAQYLLTFMMHCRADDKHYNPYTGVYFQYRLAKVIESAVPGSG